MYFYSAPSQTAKFGKIQPFPMQSLDFSLLTDACCLEISLTCFSPDDIITLGITYMPYLKPRMTLPDTPLLPNLKRSPAKAPYLGTKEPLPLPLLKAEVQGDITHPKLNMDVSLPWYLIAAIFNCRDKSTGRASRALWTHHWPRSWLCWDLPALCSGTDQGCSQGVVCSLCSLSLATFLSVQSWQDPHVPRQHRLVSVFCGVLWEIQLSVRNKQTLPSSTEVETGQQ